MTTRGPMNADEGFSTIELLVAAMLAVLVFTGVIGLANPSGHVANVQPDAVDMNQRLRVGAATFARGVYAAGAGLDVTNRGGPLARFLPAVLPRRIGATNADAPDVARADTLSLLWVPETYAQTTVSSTFSGSSITLAPAPGCPIGEASCGFEPGMGAVVFDASGRFDLFTVIGVLDADLAVRRRGAFTSQTHSAGATIAEIQARTYYYDATAKQLRMYDTDLTDLPVLDDVTEIHVDYFGAPGPPVWPKPPLGEANCLYDTAGTPLASGPILSPGNDGQAELPLSLFVDGPWCGAGETRFDADLLRIRRVRVTLGVQASSSAHRGIGSSFQSSGISRSAWRSLADMSVTFDISPRNLMLLDEGP